MTGDIEVPLTSEEAAALADAMQHCRDTSVRTHWRLGRTRLDGTVLVMDPKWGGVPVWEYLQWFTSGLLAEVSYKIEATWFTQKMVR